MNISSIIKAAESEAQTAGLNALEHLENHVEVEDVSGNRLGRIVDVGLAGGVLVLTLDKSE